MIIKFQEVVATQQIFGICHPEKLGEDEPRGLYIFQRGWLKNYQPGNQDI